VLGLRHLGLGGVAPAEAIAIEAELTAWQKAGGFQDRDNALRYRVCRHAVLYLASYDLISWQQLFFLSDPQLAQLHYVGNHMLRLRPAWWL